jgi:hypothetical protein
MSEISPQGTASSEYHASTNTVCELCSAGKYASNVGSTQCLECHPGTYATDDPDEDTGGLEYQVALGATLCQDCPAGYFQSASGAIVCDHCDGGYYSGARSSNCSTCPPGTRSHKGDSSCENCWEGTYNNLYGAERCEFCPDGYWSQVGATVCDDAASGYYLGYSNHSWSSVICPDHATCFGGVILLILSHV